MTTDKIMALAEEFVAAAAREGYMPGGFGAAQVKLRTAIDSLVADAARYRWLRAEHPCRVVVNWNIGVDWIDIRFEQLDAAIDEAMGLDKR
jgi:hypothetical protein